LELISSKKFIKTPKLVKNLIHLPQSKTIYNVVSLILSVDKYNTRPSELVSLAEHCQSE